MKSPIRQIVPTVAGLVLVATASVAAAQADQQFEAAPVLAGTQLASAAWDQPPGDLAKGNAEKLQRMGVPADVVRAFLRNRCYTPTQQTALIAAPNGG